MKIASAALAVWLAISASALFLATQQPYLGIQWRAGAILPGLEIAQVSAGSPAEGRLHLGERIVALQSEDGIQVPLELGDVNPDPSYVGSYAKLNAFLDKQQRIATLLRERSMTLIRPDGSQVHLVPWPHTPWLLLPPLLIFQLGVLPGLALFIATAILRRRTEDWAARYFAVCALGYALMVSAHAVMSLREFALPGDLFRLLLSINHCSGLILLVGSSTAVIWHYPTRYGRLSLPVWSYGVMAIVAALNELRLPGTLSLGLLMPSIGAFAVQAGLVSLQWRRAAERPAHRAVLKWLIIPWFGCIGLYVLLLMMPVVLGLGPKVPQTVGWALLLLVFVGQAFGVTRFRLYYVNPANILVWLADGLCVIALTLIGWHVFSLEPFFAGCLALFFAGFFHSPIRNVVWSAQNLQHADFERVLKLVLAALSPCRDPIAVQAAWFSTLKTLFEPQSLLPMTNAVGPARIESDGERMYVPAAAGSGGVTLALPFGGRSLFIPQDLDLAGELWKIFNAIAHYWESHMLGQQSERRRLVQELELRLHQPLAQLVRASPREELRRLAASAQQEVRRVVQALSAGARFLPDVLPEWPEEAAQRCAPAGIQCEWRLGEPLPQMILQADVLLNLHNILREALTNVIRHSGASTVKVLIEADTKASVLSLSIEDDGVCPHLPPVSGRGIGNMRRRSEELAAELQLDRGALGGLRVRLRLPVPRTGDSLPDPGPLGSTQ